ncbi:hypothetical protein N9L13_07315 [Flavobacteriales bacterium]|jgi:hypothetical protein|nr:hypothetical protein [Flavobacteriales bacterium]
MDKFFKEINKYVVSILLLFAGLGFLGKYLSGDALESQPTAMLISSLALIAVAALATPYVLSRLQASHYRIMMIAGTVVAVWLGYEVFYSVDEEIQFRELKTQVDAETIQALKDIRDAQEAHQQIYGVFCDDFDSLQRFIYEPVMPVSFNMGSFNDTLPESKSAEMGLILTRAELPAVAEEMGLSEEEFIDLIAADSTTYKVRDVIYTTFYNENFTPEIRSAKRLPRVAIDSLWFNPLSGERFRLEIDSVESGGVLQSTILVKDPTPFGREKVKKDTLRFGSLTEAHTDGNWRN